MQYQIASVVGIQSHHDVEEVGSVDLSSLRKFVREVAAELRVLYHIRIELFYTQLIILWDVDPLYILHREESLLFGENLLQEVFVHADIWWNIELTIPKYERSGGLLTLIL